jgi:hypothetical protein
MKNVFVVAAACVILASGDVTAQAGSFGLGVILGEPTGLSAKAWLTKERAIDAAAAWSTYHDGFFQMHADLLFHEYRLIEVAEARGRIPLSYGVGGRIVLGKDDEWVGVRFPFGVSYLFREVPLDVFFEIVPILDLLPDTDFDLDGAIGIRFYFGWSSPESTDQLVRGG